MGDISFKLIHHPVTCQASSVTFRAGLQHAGALAADGSFYLGSIRLMVVSYLDCNM
mgnify:CR=1 FL=1